MTGNLNLDMNTVDILLPAILLTAIVHEVVLPPETVHRIPNLLLMYDPR